MDAPNPAPAGPPQQPPSPAGPSAPAAVPSPFASFIAHFDPAGWRPAIAVAAILGAVVFGGQVADGVIPTPSIGTVRVSDGISFEAAPGWFRVGDSQDGPVDLQKADVRLSAVGEHGYSGDAAKLLRDVEQSLQQGAQVDQIAFGEAVERRLGGRLAAEAGYEAWLAGSGTPVDGELIVVVSGDGAVLVFNAYAPQGDLGGALREIESMAAKARVAQ